MAENVRVVVRCRPMSQKELDAHCKVRRRFPFPSPRLPVPKQTPEL